MGYMLCFLFAYVVVDACCFCLCVFSYHLMHLVFFLFFFVRGCFSNGRGITGHYLYFLGGAKCIQAMELSAAGSVPF